MLTFKPRHAPTSGLPFWIALSLASILGCNTGDWYASFFGFLAGLPALAAAFAIVAVLERRDDSGTLAWYWLAIVIVRTAATNLADFVSHQIGMTNTLAGLTALLLAFLALIHVRRRDGRATTTNGLPAIDGLYWSTMLTAGTLGTALGDFSSFRTGLGLGLASVLLSLLVAVLIAIKSARGGTIALSYWLVVVVIRTAGTSVGDWFAHALGLWQSTAVFAVVFVGFLAWLSARQRDQPAAI